MAKERCNECGMEASLKGRGHCRRCFKGLTIPCPASCGRRVYEMRQLCEPCKGRGLSECKRCFAWRKLPMLGHCRECVKAVKFSCAHLDIVMYKGHCVACFVEQAHTLTSYSSTSRVGTCRFCGTVPVSLRAAGAICQAWEGFRARAGSYGLTPVQLCELYLKAQGLCAICGTPEGDRAFAIDHDHACCPGTRACGQCVRNLLCSSCNSLLGLAQDSTTVLEWAIRYLENPEWKSRDL